MIISQLKIMQKVKWFTLENPIFGVGAWWIPISWRLKTEEKKKEKENDELLMKLS